MVVSLMRKMISLVGTPSLTVTPMKRMPSAFATVVIAKLILAGPGVSGLRRASSAKATPVRSSPSKNIVRTHAPARSAAMGRHAAVVIESSFIGRNVPVLFLCDLAIV